MVLKQIFHFLLNVVKHEKFRNGEYDTSFIDDTPELFDFPSQKRPWNKNAYLYWKCTVNGFPGIEKRKRPVFDQPRIPKVPFDLEPKMGRSKF